GPQPAPLWRPELARGGPWGRPAAPSRPVAAGWHRPGDRPAPHAAARPTGRSDHGALRRGRLDAARDVAWPSVSQSEPVAPEPAARRAAGRPIVPSRADARIAPAPVLDVGLCPHEGQSFAGTLWISC